MTPLMIAITGADGSGKSTACATVRASLESALGSGSVAEVSVWDCLGETRSASGGAIRAPFRSKEEAGAYLGDLDGASRTLFIFHSLSRALQLAGRSGARVLLLNGYWYKYAVSEIGYGVPAEWVISVAKAFPAADRVICLDVSPETAWERRRAATAYEQGPGEGDQGERFVGFQRKLRKIWEQVEAASGPWEHVSSELPPAEVARQLTERALGLARERGLG